MARRPTSGPKKVDSIRHDDRRTNIPTAEMQSFFQREEDHSPRPPTHYERSRPLAEGEVRARDEDRDPQILWNGMRIKLTQAQRKRLEESGEIEIGDAQLVWRGKDAQDWSALVVDTPPLYIQEKIHPKAIIEDLKRRTALSAQARADMADLFADFNGVPQGATAGFYQHDQHWSNRMILGDSLSVMASLAERERLKGKVQCIYFDPPYGIRFNSNWQVSTLSRDVKDGKQTDISREPEQVKAFRDTWKDGVHSYLTYLRDRLVVMRDLLAESGSVFVQIGDENVHRVRAVLDEVFGDHNYVSEILVKKKGSQVSNNLEAVNDYILWYARDRDRIKSRNLYTVREDEDIFTDFPNVELSTGERLSVRELGARDGQDYLSNYSAFRAKYPEARLYGLNPLKSGGFRRNQSHDFLFQGKRFPIRDMQCWKHTVVAPPGETPGMTRLGYANRLAPLKTDVRFIRYSPTPSVRTISNWWDGLGGAASPIYIVQTNVELVKRCILLTTDPGDLVLDPTCGSGTTAYVAEQWGRRWITIDTSRVALALARTRLMSARYPWYLLADSPEGRRKEAELAGKPAADGPTSGDIRLGFVYERFSSQSSGSIANNARIDDIWNRWQEVLEPLRQALNAKLKQSWESWDVPRSANESWPAKARAVHAEWSQAISARQREIDAVIAAAAEVGFLYDRPYVDTSRVRVAGPFTVESLSPHRVTSLDSSGEEAVVKHSGNAARQPENDFARIVIEYLKSSGIHQSDKSGKIDFESVAPWPGRLIAAEARFHEGDKEVQRRAAVLIGPEYGTVTRPDITAAAREANETGFDILIVCGFNFDAHSSELNRLGPLPILKARMNADLHMADELKNTGKGNLFVVFGEPDIELETLDSGDLRVTVRGVDVYDPNTGEIRSKDVRDIAAWFVDTDYNEESFFVRHAYFLGANDPFRALRDALRAEIDEDAWSTLYSAVSRPFPRPSTGRIAVKAINHFGDEVMKVLRV